MTAKPAYAKNSLSTRDYRQRRKNGAKKKGKNVKEQSKIFTLTLNELFVI